MRMLTALVCKMWRGTSFQHQKPTLLSFLRSEAHTKKQQIRCDRALKLQVPFDFPLGVSSCPICALAAALTGSQTTFMCWNGPFTFLQILVWGIFFKLKHEHNVAGDILSGGHSTLQSRLQQSVPVCKTHCSDLSVWWAKHALFHVQTSGDYENNKYQMLMSVEMSNIDQERSLSCLNTKSSPTSPFFLSDGRRGRKASVHYKEKSKHNFYGVSDVSKEGS